MNIELTQQSESGEYLRLTGELTGGLTKREIFAAMALQGLAACPSIKYDDDTLALGAVSMADALIAALAKDPQEAATDR